MSLLLEKVSAGYGGTEMISDISFSLDEGDRLSVIGKNGAGKTTLVRVLAGQLKYKGSITLDGKELSSLKAKERAALIGVLHQQHEVFAGFSVYETVMLGRYARTTGSFRDRLSGVTDEDREAVEAALSATGLTELSDRTIEKLSGGELQRAFLAQAFAQDPRILILDEPVSSLDIAFRAELEEMLGEWAKRPEKAIILIEHDLAFARSFGESFILLDKGAVAAFGSADTVFSSAALSKVYGLDVGEYMKRQMSVWV